MEVRDAAYGALVALVEAATRSVDIQANLLGNNHLPLLAAKVPSPKP